ncbi:MAG: hypothetical protein K6F35_11830 [Lachnospiraceae bacterium]|nr:hypothetical protein [Lachnospiraceae bacterium]
MKAKRILALAGVLLLLGLYISTLVLAVIGSELFSRLFLLSIVSTIAVPIILHLFLMLNNARHGRSVMDETYSYREPAGKKDQELTPPDGSR